MKLRTTLAAITGTKEVYSKRNLSLFVEMHLSQMGGLRRGSKIAEKFGLSRSRANVLYWNVHDRLIEDGYLEKEVRPSLKAMINKFRLTDDEYNELQDLAELNDLPVTALARIAIKAYLKQNRNPQFNL